MKSITTTILSLFFLLSFAQQIDSLNHESMGTQRKIYPVFGYTPVTGFDFGVAGLFLISHDTLEGGYNRPTVITPAIIYTSKHQSEIITKVEMYTKSGMNIVVNAGYYNFPISYFGIGQNVDPEIKEIMETRYGRLEGWVTKSYRKKNWFYGASFDIRYFQTKEFNEGGLFDSHNPFGRAGGRNIGIGPLVQYDTRSNTVFPTSGKYVQMGVKAYSKVFGSEFSYLNYLFDYRQYMKVLGPKNILAFQFLAELTSNGQVPFFKKLSIGGENRLRGIDHKNLYIDDNIMYAQVEGRQELFGNFGGVLFAGVGQSFSSFSSRSSSKVHFVRGLGVRYRLFGEDHLNIRLDYGVAGNGESAIYFSILEAF